jgi:hypothetical protein
MGLDQIMVQLDFWERMRFPPSRSLMCSFQRVGVTMITPR